MTTYFCTPCAKPVDTVRVPYTESYPLGEAHVSEVTCELRCDVCGSDQVEECALCVECGEARMASGFDECERCVARAFIADPDGFDDFVRIHGRESRAVQEVEAWITREFRAELERPMSVGFMRRRQAN